MAAEVAAVLLATAVVVVVVAVIPTAGWKRYQRLLRDLRTDERARLPFYLETIIQQWELVAVVVLAGVLGGQDLRAIGLPDYGPGTADGWLITVVLAGAAIGAVPVLILTHRFAPPLDESVARQLAPHVGMVPATRRERRVFVLVALTAGICEEVVFRGFGIAYLRWLWPGAQWAVLILATAVPFGLGHRYQGRNGMIAAGIIGVVLGWITLVTGTLIPAIAIHAAFDLRVLALREDLVDEVMERQHLAAPPA